MSIEIKTYEPRFFDALIELALNNYRMEQAHNCALRNDIDPNYFAQKINVLISKGFCNVALENGNIVGFLSFEKNASSAASPLYGYGINHKKRGEVISKLFQSAASTLCENYIQRFWVNIYAHDSDVIWMYIMSAFTMDVTDVVRNTNSLIESNPIKYSFREVNKTELLRYRGAVIELYRNLINHLRVSPVFYHCKYFLPIEDRFEDFVSENMRIFAAFDGNRLIGMVNAELPDKGFATEDKNAMSLGDLFVAPAYRRNGVGAALLDYANRELRKNGTERIFVTHGTINPTARGFWDKYFKNYSYTMTRQIDPNMLGIIKPV